MSKINWSLLFQCTWLCSIGAVIGLACTCTDDIKAKAAKADEYCRLYYLHLREVADSLSSVSSVEEPLRTAIAERFVKTSEDRLRFDNIMDCSQYRLNVQDMRICAYRKDYTCMTSHLIKVVDSFHAKVTPNPSP